MSDSDTPEVRSTRKMQLNPEPLKVVHHPEVRCRRCGQTWGMRGKCVCLHADPYEVEEPSGGE